MKSLKFFIILSFVFVSFVMASSTSSARFVDDIKDVKATGVKVIDIWVNGIKIGDTTPPLDGKWAQRYARKIWSLIANIKRGQGDNEEILQITGAAQIDGIKLNKEGYNIVISLKRDFCQFPPCTLTLVIPNEDVIANTSKSTAKTTLENIYDKLVDATIQFEEPVAGVGTVTEDTGVVREVVVFIAAEDKDKDFDVNDYVK